MVKLNTKRDEIDENIAEVAGMILCGMLVSVPLGFLGLGLGLMFLNWLPGIGLGLVSGTFGFLIGLRGGYKVVQQQRSSR